MFIDVQTRDQECSRSVKIDSCKSAGGHPFAPHSFQHWYNNVKGGLTFLLDTPLPSQDLASGSSQNLYGPEQGSTTQPPVDTDPEIEPSGSSAKRARLLSAETDAPLVSRC